MVHFPQMSLFRVWSSTPWSSAPWSRAIVETLCKLYCSLSFFGSHMQVVYLYNYIAYIYFPGSISISVSLQPYPNIGLQLSLAPVSVISSPFLALSNNRVLPHWLFPITSIRNYTNTFLSCLRAENTYPAQTILSRSICEVGIPVSPTVLVEYPLLTSSKWSRSPKAHSEKACQHLNPES